MYAKYKKKIELDQALISMGLSTENALLQSQKESSV